ncbi:MAG: helicase C-terminal domain-containing protein [Candidatus Sigynarchaeota archaeon]
MDRKGIIHTFSYDNAEYLYANINPSIKKRLILQNREDRTGSLDKWMKSDPPSIFVSTAMSEGLDLKDDLCRYQIYLKMGFPNLSNPRVHHRKVVLHDEKWYWFQAIEDIEQASGRATRSKSDWSEMFVFDASLTFLLTKYKRYFKNWFLDRIKRVRDVASIHALAF